MNEKEYRISIVNPLCLPNQGNTNQELLVSANYLPISPFINCTSFCVSPSILRFFTRHSCVSRNGQPTSAPATAPRAVMVAVVGLTAIAVAGQSARKNVMGEDLSRYRRPD